jgi:hypothetical protein
MKNIETPDLIPEKNIKSDSQTEILKDILVTNQEILAVAKETAASAKYVKNHFRFELIVTIVKWVFIVAFIVLSAVSLGALFTGLKGGGGGLNLSSISEMLVPKN